MPIDFGSVVKKNGSQDWKSRSSDAGLDGSLQPYSKWNMYLYAEVDREIQNAENITLCVKFLSNAYEEDFKETGKWCKNFENFAEHLVVKP